MVTERTRDRAQVILIGAIVIAFVVLGVVVVLNGLVHTEEVSSSSTTQSVNHAETTETVLINDVRRMIAEEYDDEYEVSDETELEHNITAYTNTAHKLQGNTSPSAIELTNVDVVTDSNSPYDVGMITGDSLGPGSGNNVEIDGEMYLFTYDTAGKDAGVEYIFHTADGEETSVEVRDAGTDIIVEDEDGDECRRPKGSVIDFVDGTIDGEMVSCDISVEDLPDDVIEVEFAGPGIGQDIGTYEIIADGLDPGSAAENHANNVGGVTFAEATITYASSEVASEKHIRMTGIGAPS